MASELYVTDNNKVEIYRDPRTTEVAVRVVDIIRLYDEVRQLPENTNLYGNAAWGCFGFSVSFIVAAISLPASAQDLSPWLLPVFWVGAIAAGIVGILSVCMQKSHDKINVSDKHRCIRLLKDIVPMINSSVEDFSKESHMRDSDLSYKPVDQALSTAIADNTGMNNPTSLIKEQEHNISPGGTAALNVRKDSILQANINKSVFGKMVLPREGSGDGNK